MLFSKYLKSSLCALLLNGSLLALTPSSTEAVTFKTEEVGYDWTLEDIAKELRKKENNIYTDIYLQSDSIILDFRAYTILIMKEENLPALRISAFIKKAHFGDDVDIDMKDYADRLNVFSKDNISYVYYDDPVILAQSFIWYQYGKTPQMLAGDIANFALQLRLAVLKPGREAKKTKAK